MNVYPKILDASSFMVYMVVYMVAVVRKTNNSVEEFGS